MGHHKGRGRASSGSGLFSKLVASGALAVIGKKIYDNKDEILDALNKKDSPKKEVNREEKRWDD